MLDIKFIRENKNLVKEALKRRGLEFDIENLLKIDEKRRKLIQEIERLRKEKNQISTTAKQKGIEKARSIKKDLSKKEPQLKEIREELNQILLSLPNLPDPEVPDGQNETDNKVIRQWGKPKKFNFAFKDHISLGKKLDIIDMERGAKVSGSGFYYLKNEGALLEMALMQYAIDKLQDKGFQFFITPDLVKEKAMIGTGFFPAEENEIYKIDRDNLYLVGTAEVALASYHADELIEAEKLPLRYSAFSSCFRREAGAYGKTAKGVFRVHQFNKIEMFVITKPEDSEKEHQKLVEVSEEILRGLNLPYEVVLNCIGDLGFSNKKRYDINTWMPYWKTYRETHSASNDGEFQARRLGIRYRDKKGTINYCHTLNNTALASPRLIVAILENYQQEDGAVVIPNVLRPYLKFEKIAPKP